MKLTYSALLLVLPVSLAFEVPSLTPDNYDELTEGKTVFIKFFAPWCGHCKKMKASWEKLAEEWADHEVGLVAEVDCTDEGKPLCEVNGVRGYPTIKYGDPEDLDDYEGGRNFEELSKFAKENLKPLCSPKNLEQCDDDTKKLFDEYMTMPLEKLEEKITELEQELLDAENSFREETGKLKDAYQKLTEEKEAKLAAVNNAGLRVLKSIKNFMRQSAKDEL